MDGIEHLLAAWASRGGAEGALGGMTELLAAFASAAVDATAFTSPGEKSSVFSSFSSAVFVCVGAAAGGAVSLSSVSRARGSSGGSVRRSSMSSDISGRSPPAAL